MLGNYIIGSILNSQYLSNVPSDDIQTFFNELFYYISDSMGPRVASSVVNHCHLLLRLSVIESCETSRQLPVKLVK